MKKADRVVLKHGKRKFAKKILNFFDKLFPVKNLTTF